MKYASLLVASVLLATAAAVAGTSQYAAKLAQPLPKNKEVFANRNVWKCNGETCVLASAPMDADGLLSCRELRRQVGVLTAYGAEEKPFDADKLAKCNNW